MLLGTVWPPKQPTENFPVGIDFADDLAVGETIATSVTTAKRLSDGTDVSATVLSGIDVVAGTIVEHRVIGGTTGELYRIQIRITTSGSNTFEHEVDLPVEET